MVISKEQPPKENDDIQIVFNISDVSKIIDVVPATIRNWEKVGLIKIKREKNNYRVFDFHDIEVLKKIKEYSDNNMSISTIKQLLSNNDLSYQPVMKKYYKEFYHAKLKKYRENEGYTLEDVSKAVGISPSYLSRIEQGKVSVSYEILDKLATFYGESTIRFFDIKKEKADELIKKGKGKQLETGINGVTIESLIDTNESTFQSVRFTIEPECGDYKSHSHHSGEEFIYVLIGKLQITLDDTQEFILREGDSIHFKSNRMHKWHNPGNKVTEIIWIHSYI